MNRAAFLTALKVATVVALLALLSADFGLRTTVVLFCKASPSHNEWCPEAIDELHKLNEWVFRNVFDARLTDILLVVFTYFLVRVGRGQQKVMSTQAAITKQQTGILEKQLLSQGPLFGYDIYKLEIKADDPEKTKLRDYKISLLWRNFGKDIATNVTYWIGPVFEAYADNDPAQRQSTAERFRDTIFKATALSGHVAVAPGGTVETDQIILSPAQLRALYRKQIRFFVWCVLGYRSRLQSDNWFEEIAVYLEFVLDRDPDSFGLTDKATEGGPLRVAIVGYRYRTVDERSPA